MKDWTGNKHSIYTCLGASNHVEEERQTEDFYATDPIAAKLLLEVEPKLDNIWECSVGQGHLAKVFDNAGKLGRATDLVYRGYGETESVDFLQCTEKWDGDIVTNPPYILSSEFILKALELVRPGRKVCMFLKVTFLEGKGRKQMFLENPPKTVYISSSRIPCAKNGEFEVWNGKKQKMEQVSSAVAYAWYVWEKGFTGKPVIEWIN